MPLREQNALPGHIIVPIMPVRFVGPVKNILIHMTNIEKQFPEPMIRILDYFFRNKVIAETR